jgi:hypothetical protein
MCLLDEGTRRFSGKSGTTDVSSRNPVEHGRISAGLLVFLMVSEEKECRQPSKVSKPEEKSMPTSWWFRFGALVLTAPVAIIAAETIAQDRVVQLRAGAPGTWRVIGHVTANSTSDHVGFVVRAPFGDFRSVRFKVTDAPLDLRRLVVTYHKGEPERLELRERIEKGGRSRAIDLPGGGQRSVRRIEFWYEAAGLLQEAADVTLFGMRRVIR